MMFLILLIVDSNHACFGVFSTLRGFFFPIWVFRPIGFGDFGFEVPL